MTIEQLNTKRDEILATVGLLRTSLSDGSTQRSVEYTDAMKALSLIDSEIARVTASESSAGRFKTSFVTFSKG